MLNTLVKPSRPIPPEVTQINNITNEKVADAPAWREVFPAALKINRKQKWLAWNSRFEARLMVQT
uniref:exonuclease domain-containing protein n=1 Tax=Klebsiella pneumoniae TaxID=573 RepID=UPI0025A30BCE